MKFLFRFSCSSHESCSWLKDVTDVPESPLSNDVGFKVGGRLMVDQHVRFSFRRGFKALFVNAGSVQTRLDSSTMQTDVLLTPVGALPVGVQRLKGE